MNTNLHVYSAGCSWHGPISAVGKTKDLPVTECLVGGTKIKIGGPGSGLPCCPHCGSILYQIEEDKWWQGALQFEHDGHENYVRFLKWSMKQPTCWKSNSNAAMIYNTDPENKGFKYTHFNQ